MIPTTANAAVPHLGRPGASTVEAAINHCVTRVNAGQELDASLMGGPGFYGGNVGQREENDGTHEVQGSHVGQKHTGWKQTHSELASWQSPWTITSVLEAEEGASVRRRGGGVLQVKRHHGGPGVIEDDAALIRLHDETRASGNLIEDQSGRFVVDNQRRVFAPAGVFNELWVGGVPVLSLLTGAAAPVTDFQDSTFTIYDNLDNTKVGKFVADSISPATTRNFTFPDQSGTLALLSDLAALGEFADTVFRVQDDADPTKELAFECAGITAGNTRFLTVPDMDGTIALVSDVVTSHGDLDDLLLDDHTQYLLLAGRGGQTVVDTVTFNGVTSADYSVTGAAVGAGTVTIPMTFEPSNPAAAGLAGDGWRIPFLLENDASVSKEVANFQVEWADATNGAEESAVTITGQNGGVLTHALSCDFLTMQVVLAGETWDYSAVADGDMWVRSAGVWSTLRMFERQAVSAGGNLTIVAWETRVALDSTGGAFTSTLPDPASVPVGTRVRFKDEAYSATAEPVTIDAAAGNVEGGASYDLDTDGMALDLESDGTAGWWVT